MTESVVLTREQVDQLLLPLLVIGFMEQTKDIMAIIQAVKAHDAALRAHLAQQAIVLGADAARWKLHHDAQVESKNKLSQHYGEVVRERNALRAQLAEVTHERDARMDAMSTLRAGYDECIAQLEARLAQRDARIEGLEARIAQLEAVVNRHAPSIVDRERFQHWPCYLCGYSGKGYYQPEHHPCASPYHAQIAERDARIAQVPLAPKEAP